MNLAAQEAGTAHGRLELCRSRRREARSDAQAIRLFSAPLPVVAADQGAAICGGLGLPLLADFRVAARDALLAANFTRLGLHHGFGLTETLPRLVGVQEAARMLYTVRKSPVRGRPRLGCAMRPAPASQLGARAHELATAIACRRRWWSGRCARPCAAECGPRSRLRMDCEHAEQVRPRQTQGRQGGHPSDQGATAAALQPGVVPPLPRLQLGAAR